MELLPLILFALPLWQVGRATALKLGTLSERSSGPVVAQNLPETTFGLRIIVNEGNVSNDGNLRNKISGCNNQIEASAS